MSAREQEELADIDVTSLPQEAAGCDGTVSGRSSVLDDVRVASATRRDSTASSSSDGSVAVNCTAFPTEVIVHGRKVQKVRVLFTPQPPPKLTASIERRHLRRGARQSRGYSSTQVVDESGIPFSQEESSTWTAPDSSTDNFLHPAAALPRVTSLPEPLELQSHGGPPSSEERSQTGGDDEGRKMLLNLMNWLDHAEHTKTELQTTNFRLEREIDALRQQNKQLCELLADNQRRFDVLVADNDELKAKLDASEKEVERLGEKATKEWHNRVAVEEKLVEMKRDSDALIRSLREELDRKNVEAERQADTSPATDANNNATNRGGQNPADGDTLELLIKLSSLEDSVARFRAERDRLSEDVSRLERDVVVWKDRFDAKSQEFDVQATRFESLSQSFSHLKAENERLRNQFVVRSTVPAASKPAEMTSLTLIRSGSGTAGGESTSSLVSSSTGGGSQLHTVQLPATLGNGPISAVKRNSSSVVIHKVQFRRKKSEDSTSGSSTVETLPPVWPNKFAK